MEFLRIEAVVEARGSSRSTVYREADDGLFPRPVKVGPNISAWPRHELTQCGALDIAARDCDDRRAFDRWESEYTAAEVAAGRKVGEWFHRRAERLREMNGWARNLKTAS